MTGMSVTMTTKGTKISVSFTATLSLSLNTFYGEIGIFLDTDTTPTFKTRLYVASASEIVPVSITYLFKSMLPISHTISVKWQVQNALQTFNQNERAWGAGRNLEVLDLP